MADGIEDKNEPVTDKGDRDLTPETTVSTVSFVASSLAGFFLEENVKQGREIEIPSLGIKIGKANLRKYGARSHDNIKEDKE